MATVAQRAWTHCSSKDSLLALWCCISEIAPASLFHVSSRGAPWRFGTLTLLVRPTGRLVAAGIDILSTCWAERGSMAQMPSCPGKQSVAAARGQLASSLQDEAEAERRGVVETKASGRSGVSPGRRPDHFCWPVLPRDADSPVPKGIGSMDDTTLRAARSRGSCGRAAFELGPLLILALSFGVVFLPLRGRG